MIGYPLRGLNDRYKGSVTRDVELNVGGALASWNPLSHTGYLTDGDVTKPIAASLARAWKQVNAA